VLSYLEKENGRELDLLGTSVWAVSLIILDALSFVLLVFFDCTVMEWEKLRKLHLLWSLECC
jgi:hypothetical protein